MTVSLLIPQDCVTGTYHAHPKCKKFFVCVNQMLIAQSCAPGLIWRQDKTQCDFPSATSCSDKRQGVSAPLIDASNTDNNGINIEKIIPSKNNQYFILQKHLILVLRSIKKFLLLSEYCNNGEYASFPSDCKRYQHCIFGKFEEFSCSGGLYWNQVRSKCTHAHLFWRQHRVSCRSLLLNIVINQQLRQLVNECYMLNLLCSSCIRNIKISMIVHNSKQVKQLQHNYLRLFKK